MDSFRFTHQLRHHLDHGTQGLSPAIAGELRRRRALALQHRSARQLRTDVLVWQSSDWVRRWAPTVMFVFMIAMAAMWQERLDDTLEVDAGLLADEVPLNAYLDHSLGTWLEKTSQE